MFDNIYIQCIETLRTKRDNQQANIQIESKRDTQEHLNYHYWHSLRQATAEININIHALTQRNNAQPKS